MQKRHLQTTLSNIGLGSEPSIEELRECFKTKYSGIFPQLMFIVQRMDDVTAELMKNLDINNNIKVFNLRAMSISTPEILSVAIEAKLTCVYG